MKLLAIFLDANGAIQIEATRAPDLRRRAISQEAGGAEIIFCAAPPLGQSASQLAARFRERLAAAPDTDPVRIRRMALWQVHVRPELDRAASRMRRYLRLMQPARRRTANMQQPIGS